MVSKACQMRADHTVSRLLSDGELKKDRKRVGGWTLLCNPQDNFPKVQGRRFNHTADYATTAREPADEEGGNLSLEPCSTQRCTTCPALGSPAKSGALA